MNNPAAGDAAHDIGYPRLDFFTVTSTLDIAREQVRRGAPHGALITASHQTAGRGRRGAKWHDEAGASALMTFILRDEANLITEDSWRIPFVASLACVEYLRDAGYADAQVKWPNDLVVYGCKTGGILVEACLQSDGHCDAFLLGIGINVMQQEFSDAERFASPPISLRLAAERHGATSWPNAVQVIEGVASHVNDTWQKHLASGEELVDSWRAYQMVGQRQSGVDLATGRLVSGVYRDVRSRDGAGLIAVEGGGIVAVMPSAG